MIPVPQNQKEATNLKQYYIGSRLNQIPLPDGNLVRKFLKEGFDPKKRWFGFNETRRKKNFRKIYPRNVLTSSVHNTDLLIQILDYADDVRWFIHIYQNSLDDHNPKCDISVFNREVTFLMKNTYFGYVFPELQNMGKIIGKLK